MSGQGIELWSDAIGAAGSVVRHGHWGRPVLAFPAEQGCARDYEHNGMIGAIAGLLDAGRVKLYCVDSYDAASWSCREIPLEERARKHAGYESWILGTVLPWISQDCGGAAEVITLGRSLGAFHAAKGQWEDTTGSLASTTQFATLLASKGIRHELDLWGHDVPHDWPSWRAQLAHHLPRFC